MELDKDSNEVLYEPWCDLIEFIKSYKNGVIIDDRTGQIFFFLHHKYDYSYSVLSSE